MPYLAFDLDAKKRVPKVARAVGIEPAFIGWGLLELWEHVWDTKRDTVSEVILDCCFGPDPRVRAALEANGFLEWREEGWRVRGAGRYLRISEARSAAGKKRAAKASRDESGRLVAGGDAGDPSSKLPANAGDTTSGQPALTPSTEHRAPNLDSTTTAGKEPRPVPLPKKPAADERWSSGQAFFAWCQHERVAAGFATEKAPARLSAWFSEVMLELNGDGERLDATVAAFARDPYWRDKGLPFNALIDQWRKYVPRKAVAS